MGALSIYLRDIAGGGLAFWCPGCREVHVVQHGQGPGPRWVWNGDPIHPTFTPSVLVTGVKRLTDEQHAAWRRGEGLPEPVPSRCHTFVTDGRINYLSDCSHELAGQIVDMVPMPAGFES